MVLTVVEFTVLYSVYPLRHAVTKRSLCQDSGTGFHFADERWDPCPQTSYPEKNLNHGRWLQLAGRESDAGTVEAQGGGPSPPCVE